MSMTASGRPTACRRSRMPTPTGATYTSDRPGFRSRPAGLQAARAEAGATKSRAKASVRSRGIMPSRRRPTITTAKSQGTARGVGFAFERRAPSRPVFEHARGEFASCGLLVWALDADATLNSQVKAVFREDVTPVRRGAVVEREGPHRQRLRSSAARVRARFATYMLPGDHPPSSHRPPTSRK